LSSALTRKRSEPESTILQTGNVRDGLVTGANDRKIGRDPSSVSAARGSQIKFFPGKRKRRRHPIAPLAVKVNGVPIGIV